MHEGTVELEWPHELELDEMQVDAASLAKERVLDQIDALPFEQRFSIRWFYGIGGICIGPEEIGDRLNLDKTKVWERICSGMEEIGFAILETVVA
jgi:hypothetical protein